MIPALENLPDILLPYQQRAMKLTATSAVSFIEKSRRVGLTWGIATDAVLTSAVNKAGGGMDTFYIGFNLDMTKEFIDTCAEWAKRFSYAAGEVQEFIFKDDNEREIQAFRIRFDSGFDIVALTSRPRSLRGRQGYVIIDEAAFHDDLKELMKAALALLMWGGKVLVISTHDGKDNAFNQYIEDIRSGRLKYGLMRIDFDDALRDGLYKRICLTKGVEWTQAVEDAWRQDMIDFYGEGADEELFCQPRNGGGTYMSGVLVESRMTEAPVLRFSCDDQFVYLPDYQRERTADDWCEEHLKPLLDALSPKQQHFFGEDFGRSGDLTVLWPLVLEQNLTRRTPFVVELKNVPFTQQRQIVWYILDRLPRFTAGAFDARGNGSQLAEETMQRYGSNRIIEVMITQQWYLDSMPKYKAAFEDGTILIPRDADILNDHRVATMVRGIPQIPDKRTKGSDGNQRHGDSLIAGAMAFWSSLQDVVEYAYTSINQPRKTSSLRDRDPDPDFKRRARSGFNPKGTW